MNKTMVSFRINNKTRDLLLELQRNGGYRTQADVISAALESLASNVVNNPTIPSDRVDAITAQILAHATVQIDQLVTQLTAHVSSEISTLRAELVDVNSRLMAIENDDQPPMSDVELVGDDSDYSDMAEKKTIPQLTVVN